MLTQSMIELIYEFGIQQGRIKILIKQATELQQLNQQLKAELQFEKIAITNFDLFSKVLERDKICVYCGNTKNLSLDHLIPLSKGGAHSLNNVVIACVSCNCSKNDTNIIRWLRSQHLPVPSIIIELLKSQNLI